MFGKRFTLSEETLPIVEEIGKHMPGGFFIYKAAGEKELLYINKAAIGIFGCETLDEFRELTGFTFPGMIYPEDYAQIADTILRPEVQSEEQLKHLEYRIVRKDGALRWVDDYGHYTETDAYGGINYVFVSDITEKREQMEADLAVRQAVIEALSESYHTVWLINDVESERFSLYRGDTEGESEHAEPNQAALKQITYSRAKDYYIQTSVAECDRERLDRELALPEIIRNLKERPQYSVNYLRTMRDGSERYFRIEFAKLNMPGGKLGVVCGFKDVDEEVRQEQAIQKALRDAEARDLEHKIRMQEQLLEQEKLRAERDSMITAMASDYRSVFHVDLDADNAVCYRADADNPEHIPEGTHFPFYETFRKYGLEHVSEEYRDGFLRYIDPDEIRKALSTEKIIAYRYLARNGEQEYYEMLRMAGVRHPADRDDHIVHAVGIGFTIIDKEMRQNIEHNRALSSALSAAEEANRAKTVFLSNMSHEIRTPMNAIIGLNKIALDNPELPDETREQLEKIGDSAQHLLSIINDILDMSRIESGRMTIHAEEFSFARTMEQVNSMIGGQCRDKGLAYECSILNRIGEYYIGDDMKLRQILINILGNAVKFTPEGGSIRMTVEETARYEGNATLRFVISDTGIGMSPEFLPRLFETFTQEDSSFSNKYGSTGLGMPITKMLVELMNGRIEVESKKGTGTTFTVYVTLKESDRQESDIQEPVPAPEQDPAETLKGRRILLAEDVPVNAEIMMMVLGLRGIEVDHAENGKIAAEKYLAHEPGWYDAVLMDMRMPVMDGLEAARAIRASGRPDAETIPIVALTANAFDEDVQRSMQAGLNAHLSKPVEPDVLGETLEKLILRKE